MPKKTVLEKFMSKIEVDPNNDHWIWKKISSDGRLLFSFRDEKGKSKTKMARRFAWETFVEELDQGVEVWNSCGNSLCVNPHHQMLNIFENRFWSKVEITDNCWIWKGHKNERGYGFISKNKKVQKTHRISWEIHRGKIPEGMCVCHRCDNPSCINPDHLFLGSHTENMKDMVEKGRSENMRGENYSNSKLTALDVKTIRNMKRNMRIKNKELAEMFNVSPSHISSILSGRCWGWLD